MNPLAENRRVRFDYAVKETYEAGIELAGGEVKSVKAGRMNLTGSYVIIRRGEAWLVGADIPAYQPGNSGEKYDSQRTRRLLFRRSEIKDLSGRLNEKGLSALPLKAYTKRNLIKIEVGLARARKKSDKREVLKKRNASRDMRDY